MKSAVSYISSFEEELVKFARARKCDGVICGHIHHPANTYYGDIHYLNSGDWVETLSALTEDENGNWDIVHYDEMLVDEHVPNVSAYTCQQAGEPFAQRGLQRGAAARLPQKHVLYTPPH